MKKWLFNDCCGLTAAVKSGDKTMTRRVAKDIEERYDIDQDLTDMLGNPTGKSETLEEFALRVCPIKVGEEIAVAESYKSLWDSEYLPPRMEDEIGFLIAKNHPGITNKLFVRAELMPVRVKVTAIRFERLQDISDEDCLKEGIIKMYDDCNHRYVYGCITGNKKVKITPSVKVEVGYDTPQEAFAYLIEKVSGKGVWESNPYVYAYTFEKV